MKFGALLRKVHPETDEPRKLSKEAVKIMYAWSHYSFNVRLQSAALTRGVHVRFTPEPGTSGTCGRCGRWNAHLGARETFSCTGDGCGWTTNRDLNGARNNLLAALTLTRRQHGLLRPLGVKRSQTTTMRPPPWPGDRLVPSNLTIP